MPQPFRLQPLLDLAQTRMDEAARTLGELIARENEDVKKLEILENYRAEYQSRFEAAMLNGMAPDAWRNFSAFIGKLDEAIRQQRAVLERARQHTAAGQQAWMAQRNKVKAFDTLSMRHQAQQQQLENKREQKFSDEHAAKRFRDQQ